MIYKTIEELTTVVTGGTPSTSKAEYWENGNIPWLQSGCCQNCDVNQADKFISQSGYDNSSTQVMPVNTVMIALTGATAGKVGYLNIEACGNQSITGIFPCEELNPRFLFYFLISQRRKILVDCVGGAQAHISQGYVKKIKVPVYSKSIQERIVNIMNICSKNIKHYEMILKEYDELVKARFVEMFENDNYPIEKLGEICEKITDGTHKTPTYLEEGITFISAKNIVNGELDFTDIKYISEEAYQEIQKRCQTSLYDILLSKSGSLGYPVIVKTKEKLGLFESLAVLKYDREKILPEFLCEQLKTNRIQRQFYTGTKGVAIKHLHLGVIANTGVIVPPLDSQKTFADFVQQVDKSRFDIKKSITEIEREVVYD